MAKRSQQRAVLIAGPTASGKSQAAVALAERLGGVVVNADAMQVYRDLAVITARPGPDDEARAPHRLFGHVDAAERYSVGRWLVDVKAVLAETAPRRRPVIFVGGTGLYFKALLDGLSEIPDVPPDVTEGWQQRLESEGAPALHALLMERDRETALALEPGDGQRIARALAVRQASGHSIRHYHSTGARPLLSAGDIVARGVLGPGRDELYARIDARFDRMMADQAMREIEALVARGLPGDLPAMKAIGVRELADVIAGQSGLDEAIARSKTHSRRYAKRQMTWIRGQMADWPVFSDPEALLARCLDLYEQPA